MSKKKSKMDPPAIYGCEDAAARMKYRNLLQDYHELKKETDITRSRLDAGKKRKIVLAAEVRFLRRKFEYFAKAETFNSVRKEKSMQPPNLFTQAKHVTQHGRKKGGRNKLPMIPKSKPNKKCLIPPSGLEHNGRTEISKQKSVGRNITPVFDLNQDSTLEVSFPSRALTFDLNEISTGDEDFPSNFEGPKIEEVRKSLMRGPKDEVQNELMLSVCRNAAGEKPTRVGKKKISWQDPVALRV